MICCFACNFFLLFQPLFWTLQPFFKKLQPLFWSFTLLFCLVLSLSSFSFLGNYIYLFSCPGPKKNSLSRLYTDLCCLWLNLISVFCLVDFKIEIFYFCFLWMGVLYQVLIFLYFAVRGWIFITNSIVNIYKASKHLIYDYIHMCVFSSLLLICSIYKRRTKLTFSFDSNMYILAFLLQTALSIILFCIISMVNLPFCFSFAFWGGA